MTKRRILASLVVISLVLSMLAVLVPTGTVLAAPSVKESHTGASKTDINVYGADVYGFQSFTATSSYVLTDIRIMSKRDGYPGDVTVELHHVNHLGYFKGARWGGVIASTPLSTGSVNASAHSTTRTLLTVDMTAFYITNGQQYAFVVRALDGDSSNKLIINSTDAVYGGGWVYFTIDDGSSWFLTDKSRDLRFEVWGEVDASYPTVATNIPTNLTSASATLQGTLSALGSGATDADVYFEWDYQRQWDTPDRYSTASENVAVTGGFDTEWDVPIGGRPFVVRAVATNDLGKTAYGITRVINAPAWPITLFEDSYIHRHGDITHAFQRKAVYVAGRHWIFANLKAQSSAGLPLGFYYSSSANGLTWTAWESFWTPDSRVTANEADEFSIFYDGTYIHIAYVLNRWFESPNSNDLWYRRGLPNTDGTITWSAAWQIAEPQDDGVKGYPTLAVSDSGNAYITYWKTPTHSGEMESGTKHIYVTRNANTDGTWSTTTGYPHDFGSNMFSCILHLGGSNMYVITTNAGGGAGATEMKGYAYDGTTWGSATIINNTRQFEGANIVHGGRGWSVSSWGSSMYLAYQIDDFDTTHDYGDIIFREYHSGVWSDPVVVYSGTNNSGDMVLSINGATQDVYVFWTEFTPGDHFHWLRYKSRTGGIWDSEPTNWLDESQYQFVSDAGVAGQDLTIHLATYPEIYSGYLAVFYITAQSDGSYTAPQEWVRHELRMAFLTVESGPAVDTNDPADITGTSATLQGTLINTGGYPTQVAFQWGTSTAYGSTTAWQSKETGQGFSAGLTGLSANTHYYYRAIAKWGDGTTSHGTGRTFQTLSAGNPTVSTGSAVSITNSGATAQGSVTSMGDYSTVYVYFEYGLTAGYGSTTAEQTKTSTGGFSAALSGLSANTLYYFRAALRYGTTTIYGAQATFTTTAATAPTVSTGTATSITQSSGTIQGSVTSLGNYDTVYVYFQWGLTGSYEQTPTPEQAKTTTGTFSATLSGLSAGTLYYFRAVLRYGTTTIYGSQVTFTTTAASGAPGIDPPDIFRIDDVKVFSGWFEDGDQLYVINYRITYTAGDPAWDAGDYFDFVLLDGSLTRAKVPVKSWGYRPGSIYLKATAAPAWGGEYTVRIAGNPNKWGVPPTTDWVLSAGDWQGTDLAQLDAWVIALAQSMQGVYDIELVTYTEGQTHLTDQGAVVFGMGIPGLCIVRPRLCSPYAYTPPTEGAHGEIPSIDTATRVGPEIYAAATDVATFLDLDDANVPLGIIVTIIYLAVAILLTVLLGSWGAMAGLAGFGIASPILIGGAWLGVVPWAAIVIIAAVAATYSFFAIWIKGV